MLVVIAGIMNPKDVYAYAHTTVYLEVGESYKQLVTANEPIFDALSEADKEICSATWNSTNPSKRTYFTIKAKAAGSATFYICKNGKSNNDYRVRTVKVYVYNKATSTSLNITNSTSVTNGTKVNVPIYLYNTKTSTCSLSQTSPFPINVSEDTSGKAKGTSATFTSSNTKVATVSSKGVVTALTQGTSVITAKRSWTTSTGAVKTISKSIYVYCKNLPVLSIYNGTTVISNLKITTINKPTLTYKLTNMQSTDTVASVTCTSADANKFTVYSSNGSFVILPKNTTNGIAVNAIFKVVLNSDVSIHNGDAAATFTKAIPIIINKDTTVYVTGVSFSKSSIDLVRGDSYKQQANVIPTNATNKNVTYKSSNTNVVTVDSNGRVIAKGCGTATITATSNQVTSKYASYTVIVTEKPTTITKIENIATGVKLYWNENPNATSYQIYRSVEKNGSYSKIGISTGTTYTDKSGTYGTTYYYKIVVNPIEGITYASDYSNIASKTRNLIAPTITAVKKRYGQYQIRMSKNNDYDGYVIYNGASKKKALVTTTSQTATVSLSNGTYYLSARAYVNVAGEKIYSAYSKTIEVKVSSGSVKIATNKPKKTSIAKATAKKKAISLKLKKVKKATGYVIKYSTSKKFKKSKTKTKTTKKTRVTIKKLKSGKTYYIKARAYRKVNGKKYYSEYCKVKRIKIK